MSNTKAGLQDFIQTLDQSCFTVCEATGGHEALLLAMLFDAGYYSSQSRCGKG